MSAEHRVMSSAAFPRMYFDSIVGM